MRKMKLLLLFALMQISVIGVSQTVTLSEQRAPLNKLFKLIKQQTGYSFFVTDKEAVSKAGLVDVSVRDMKLEEVMKVILEGKGLVFEVVDKVVVVRKEAGREEKGDNVVKGVVKDERGVGLSGATVRVKGKNIVVQTDEKGGFEIDAEMGDVLMVSYVGFEGREIKVKRGEMMDVVMAMRKVVMDTTVVVVKGSTGYQAIDKDHPGSFDVIDNNLLNRRVSPTILNRIENLTPGLSFNNPVDGILIRGRNSIYSNVSPLIVLDNFPYDGDINNINPNDVESITILKDAAASAQWGARAGNGVIVITTKRGKTNKMMISLNSALTFQAKPNIGNLQTISSGDYIELEKWLFDKGYYEGDLSNTYLPGPITPVIEILSKLKSGKIDQTNADQLINKLKKNDVRDDLEKYFFNNIINQQYSLNVSGNSNFLNYYMSVGWDKTPSLMIGQQANRISIRSQNIFKISKKIQISTGINYVQSLQKGGENPGVNINSGSKALYPYADLVDDNGKGLPFVRDYREIYVDTVGQGKLLDWKYRPFNEIAESEKNSENRDILLTAGLRYSLFDNLNIDINYQFENSNYTSSVLNKIGAYTTRNLINTFYQPYSNIKYPVPVGGIADVTSGTLKSHQARVQLNYDKNISINHDVHAFIGWEVKNLINKSSQNRMYGYDREGSLVYPEMDFATEYPLLTDQFSTAKIPNSQSISESLDRFISVYANMVYTYKDRYVFSGSIRNDAANLFGVKTNQKGVPLWSAGINWKLSEESFYKISFLPVLRFRATYGVNGNFSRATSAFATVSFGTNQLGLRYATLKSAPNEKLRWEQVRTLNLGVDFEFRNKRFLGSIEYYSKRNKDLMAQAPIDPTVGIGPSFYGNVASIKGNGVELNLTSKNTVGKFNWETNFLFSYSLTKVSEYFFQSSQSSAYFLTAAQSLSPIVGKPMFSVYSLGWAGLDPGNGDPQGYYGKGISKDYQTMLQKTPVDSLIFHGPVQAPFYGALRNTFTWKNVSLSFNISYRLGFYFRRNSVNYNELFSTWTGHSDYSKRWQNPGDELNTNVPSLVYIDHPDFAFRDQFYRNSSALVEKGDNVRLEDISFSYLINGGISNKLPIKQIRVYAYVNNINGIIWRANKLKIDPLYPNGNLGSGKSFSIGVNVDL